MFAYLDIIDNEEKITAWSEEDTGKWDRLLDVQDIDKILDVITMPVPWL